MQSWGYVQDSEAAASCAGSELSLAVEAAKEIEASGKKARVVSMVCWELFDEQDESYKNSILPPDVTARVRSLTATSHMKCSWVSSLTCMCLLLQCYSYGMHVMAACTSIDGCPT